MDELNQSLSKLNKSLGTLSEAISFYKSTLSRTSPADMTASLKGGILGAVNNVCSYATLNTSKEDKVVVRKRLGTIRKLGLSYDMNPSQVLEQSAAKIRASYSKDELATLVDQMASDEASDAIFARDILNNMLLLNDPIIRAKIDDFKREVTKHGSQLPEAVYNQVISDMTRNHLDAEVAISKLLALFFSVSCSDKTLRNPHDVSQFICQRIDDFYIEKSKRELANGTIWVDHSEMSRKIQGLITNYLGCCNFGIFKNQILTYRNQPTVKNLWKLCISVESSMLNAPERHALLKCIDFQFITDCYQAVIVNEVQSISSDNGTSTPSDSRERSNQLLIWSSASKLIARFDCNSIKDLLFQSAADEIFSQKLSGRDAVPASFESILNSESRQSFFDAAGGDLQKANQLKVTTINDRLMQLAGMCINPSQSRFLNKIRHNSFMTDFIALFNSEIGFLKEIVHREFGIVDRDFGKLSYDQTMQLAYRFLIKVRAKSEKFSLNSRFKELYTLTTENLGYLKGDTSLGQLVDYMPYTDIHLLKKATAWSVWRVLVISICVIISISALVGVLGTISAGTGVLTVFAYGSIFYASLSGAILAGILGDNYKDKTYVVSDYREDSA